MNGGVGSETVSLDEIQKQASNAIDSAYNAGFERALEILRIWQASIDPEAVDTAPYSDGVEDAIITLEQAS
jgi:hypothetical protein